MFNKTGTMKLKILFLFVSIIFISSINGQTCCSGGIPISNNVGLENLGQGYLLFGINYDFNNLNTLNSGRTNLNDNSRNRITHSILFNTSYSITNRLSVEALLTWVNQRRVIHQFGNIDLQQTQGIGDAVVLAKYDFSKILGASSKVSLGIGAKIPIGSFDESNDMGIIYIADLQPGSGAWDLILYTALSKNFDFRPSTTFSSRVIYRSTGENTGYLNGIQGYEYGNEIQTFFGISDEFMAFKTLINPGLIIKYRKAEQDRIKGIELDNTGGKWIFIIPNISIRISPEISFNSKIEVPVLSDVDGTQLTPTFRITGGLLINLNLKKNELNFNNLKI